ncbi:[FeFe] hydrogenase H-cluster maturation GTPase HydF [Clostridiaceae bacterium HFYG-1003]|nr:[FeFe] hydrogenase H-cluster maturation GTPase HydF [Clostridiaceae bacterium HFYG-1003]
METPKANRKHIVLYGKTNAGKSSLMNRLIGQEISLVSAQSGTTTDPVAKAVELIPYGPVVLVDTGGMEDESSLGEMRMHKTRQALEQADLILYVMEIRENPARLASLREEIARRDIPAVLAIHKTDEADEAELTAAVQAARALWSGWEVVPTSIHDDQSIETLRHALGRRLGPADGEEPLVGDVIPRGGSCILVIPLDAEAPKGRLILPQVQVLRDLLDHGIRTTVVRETELPAALAELGPVDLIVTDSQVFHQVEAMVAPEQKLTSFSIALARQKGDLRELREGIRRLSELSEIEQPSILIMESCSHNVSHEDIGRVKIPALIRKKLGREVRFDYAMGNDFPEELARYDLVVHCGSCMFNRRTMLNRMRRCREAGVPITNYGMVFAYGTGILDRAIEVFLP